MPLVTLIITIIFQVDDSVAFNGQIDSHNEF